MFYLYSHQMTKDGSGFQQLSYNCRSYKPSYKLRFRWQQMIESVNLEVLVPAKYYKPPLFQLALIYPCEFYHLSNGIMSLHHDHGRHSITFTMLSHIKQHEFRAWRRFTPLLAFLTVWFIFSLVWVTNSVRCKGKWAYVTGVTFGGKVLPQQN